MIPFPVAVQLLGASSLTGTRSALTLMLCMIGARMGWVSLPEDLAFATELWVIAVVGGLAVLEETLERQHDFADLLAMIRYGTSGTAGFLVAWGLARAASAVGDPAPPAWMAGVLGVLLSMATFHLRRRVHQGVQAVSAGLSQPRTWLTRLELGTTVGVALAVLLAPALGLAFVILAAVGSVALVAGSAWLERSRRRPCPACGYRARKEAELCASCRGPLEVEVQLSAPWRLWV